MAGVKIMKHYINEITKEVFAYELDGSQDDLITDNLVPITVADLATLQTQKEQDRLNARTPDEVQMQINAEARAYLASTDWMSLRASEGGKPMSQEIKGLRADARARVI
jgi:hypothetical protein